MNFGFVDGPALALPLGALGLIFGRFVTALSYRLPRGESIVHGRSHCPACGHMLTAPDLVPVLSWVVQKGACRHCRAKISGRYPAIEGLTMALFVAAGFLAKDLAHLILLLAMTPPMVALAVIDLEHQKLPNTLLLVLAVLAVAWRWHGDQALWVGFVAALLMGIVGLGLDAGYRAVAGKSGLGMGDTKLFALTGLALPVGAFLLFLALAATLGLAFGVIRRWLTGSSRFPFAPTILTAYWIVLAGADFFDQKLVMLSRG